VIPKPINDITERDIAAIVAAQVRESHTLDFKRDLPGRDSAARHEFCADVCAFANARGGDLVFGIDEDDDGAAATISAISGISADAEQLRLQDWALTLLEPRITGVLVRAVPVTDGFVILVRVPQSTMAPHRVTDSRHFYIREGARKRPLNVPEIRSAFLRSESQAERIRLFRAERIGRILAEQTPVPLVRGAITVLHVVPLQLADTISPVDPVTYLRETRLPVVSASGSSFKVNLDGALCHSRSEAGSVAYTQLFRDGRVEAVRVFSRRTEQGRYNIPSTAYERELIDFYGLMEAELARLGLGPPVALLFSLLRVADAELGLNRSVTFYAEDDGRFDRDVVLLPDVVVTERAQADAALRPIFDLVWQSAGIACSPHYDAEGKWRGR
jgi:hypothetical protein